MATAALYFPRALSCTEFWFIIIRSCLGQDVRAHTFNPALGGRVQGHLGLLASFRTVRATKREPVPQSKPTKQANKITKQKAVVTNTVT